MLNLGDNSFYKKLKVLWITFGPFKHMAIILLVFMVIAALFEGFSLWMIIPLLEFILKEGTVTSSKFAFLYSILEFVPKNFQFLAICGTIFLFVLLKNSFVVLRHIYSSKFISQLRQY